MNKVLVACPECNLESEVPATYLGKRLKCPKCKESFIAEKAGGYDLVEPPPKPRPAEPPPIEPTTLSKPARKSKGKAAAPAPKQPEPDDEFLANMEKWAEE